MRRKLNVSFAVLVTALALLAAMNSACGGSARQKTLHASFTAASAACDGLDAWDTARQNQIVDTADPATTTGDAIRKAIAEHRAKMDKIYASCTLAYKLIGAAGTREDELSLKLAVDEAQRLFEAVRELKGAL